MYNKIFCVGLNKTGTSSLHVAFQVLGIKSVHYTDENGNNIKDIIENNFLSGNNILEGLEKYEAFSDWDRAPNTVDIVKEFDKQYPNSKFILNTRDLEGWLDSREKHVLRNQERKKKFPEENITWLRIDRRAWEEQFKSHYSAVEEYFINRENDLLIFDVTNGDGWEKLCPFLDLSIPSQPFPKKNLAPDKKPLLKRLFGK